MYTLARLGTGPDMSDSLAEVGGEISRRRTADGVQGGWVGREGGRGGEAGDERSQFHQGLGPGGDFVRGRGRGHKGHGGIAGGGGKGGEQITIKKKKKCSQ